MTSQFVSSQTNLILKTTLSIGVKRMERDKVKGGGDDDEEKQQEKDDDDAKLDLLSI